MADLNKNMINDDELDEVVGGAGLRGDPNGTWMYKFEYQTANGKFVSVVSKERYSNEAKARSVGTLARMKYFRKNPSPLVVFQNRGA